MNILERAISVLAPHACLSCEAEGGLLCAPCRLSVLAPLPSRCYLCHKVNRQYSVCVNCKNRSSLSHVWVAASYEGIAKNLVYKLKFGRANAAAGPVSQAISEQLPRLNKKVLVTHIPTANQRIRLRGYDQAQLIAKAVAQEKGWLYVPLLVRTSAKRQLGASKKEREKQLEHAFVAQNKRFLKGAQVLLIDDVVTTGATLESAAKTLKESGVKTVDAAVFAQS